MDGRIDDDDRWEKQITIIITNIIMIACSNPSDKDVLCAFQSSTTLKRTADEYEIDSSREQS